MAIDTRYESAAIGNWETVKATRAYGALTQQSKDMDDARDKALGFQVRGSFDRYGAPKDFAEMYSRYYGYCKGLVVKLGIKPGAAEDVTQEIFERLLETNALKQFDPNYKIVHNAEQIQARFQSFLTAKIEHYVRGKRDRQITHARREPVILDQPIGDGSSTLKDVLEPGTSDVATDAEDAEMVVFIRQYLTTIPKRSKLDVMDLPKVYDLIQVQMAEFKYIDDESGRVRKFRIDIPLLAAGLGISTTATHSWLGLLRSHIIAAYQANFPERLVVGGSGAAEKHPRHYKRNERPRLVQAAE